MNSNGYVKPTFGYYYSLKIAFRKIVIFSSIGVTRKRKEKKIVILNAASCIASENEWISAIARCYRIFCWSDFGPFFLLKFDFPVMNPLKNLICKFIIPRWLFNQSDIREKKISFVNHPEKTFPICSYITNMCLVYSFPL